MSKCSVITVTNVDLIKGSKCAQCHFSAEKIKSDWTQTSWVWEEMCCLNVKYRIQSKNTCWTEIQTIERKWKKEREEYKWFKCLFNVWKDVLCSWTWSCVVFFQSQSRNIYSLTVESFNFTLHYNLGSSGSAGRWEECRPWDDAADVSEEET